MENEAAKRAGQKARSNLLTKWLESLAQSGLGESALRIGTNVLTVLVVVFVVWVMQTLYRQANLGWTPSLQVAQPTAAPGLSVSQLPAEMVFALNGIPRQDIPHTTIPSRPRTDVTQYTVQSGDSVFGIATKYNLDPRTILWGNYGTLKDDVDLLKPGQVLNILPVDGTYYQWQGTESLTGVAQYFGVDPQVIIDSPANHLDPDTIGDLSHPNIQAGTWLVVPGGVRLFTNWTAQVGVTRTTPATTTVWGPGACGKVYNGAVGRGTFIWPTTEHWLSGTDYRPDLNHYGIDIAGSAGNAIYAIDAGVVIYAGWNDWGYGNLTIIDHGTGWQSLYAHQSQINVSCGESVSQGQVIGLIGATGHATGPHLHFELWNLKLGRVNPHDYLPAP